MCCVFLPGMRLRRDFGEKPVGDFAEGFGSSVRALICVLANGGMTAEDGMSHDG